jgi:hypothetical protein
MQQDSRVDGRKKERKGTEWRYLYLAASVLIEKQITLSRISCLRPIFLGLPSRWAHISPAMAGESERARMWENGRALASPTAAADDQSFASVPSAGSVECGGLRAVQKERPNRAVASRGHCIHCVSLLLGGVVRRMRCPRSSGERFFRRLQDCDSDQSPVQNNFVSCQLQKKKAAREGNRNLHLLLACSIGEEATEGMSAD